MNNIAITIDNYMLQKAIKTWTNKENGYRIDGEEKKEKKNKTAEKVQNIYDIYQVVECSYLCHEHKWDTASKIVFLI